MTFVKVERDLIEKEANMAAEPKDVANTDTTPPMKRTAKERANAELDEALRAIKKRTGITDWDEVVGQECQRIRDLFARVQREREVALAKHADLLMRPTLAEVREWIASIVAWQRTPNDPPPMQPDMRPSDYEFADEWLREHGYGGEP